jgi:hypothetical protein
MQKLNNLETYNKLFDYVVLEIEHARDKHRKFASHHEAFGVIQEELEEWWDTVKIDKPDSSELLSVAAMALAAIAELGPMPLPRL